MWRFAVVAVCHVCKLMYIANSSVTALKLVLIDRVSHATRARSDP